MPCKTNWRPLLLAPLLIALSLIGCASKPLDLLPAQPQRQAAPASLNASESESSADYLQRVQLWLQKVASALDGLMPDSAPASK